MEKIVGYSVKEFEADYEFWLNITFPEDRAKVETHYKRLTSGEPSQAEWRIVDKWGQVKWLEARGTPVHNADGELVKVTGVTYEVTERKKAEEQLHRFAYHDYLTGLPNRYKLKEQLQKSLVSCEQNDQTLAVLFLDLDRFKFVNDTRGHEVGDALLQQVAEGLTRNVRQDDMVARQGGDEFIILLEKVDEVGVREIAERILESFKDPFVLNDEELFISPSIGISLYPNDGEKDEDLIKNADAAMYLAKKRGKNNYQFFVHETEDLLERRTALEYGLRKVLVQDELLLHYQPQINLETGEWKSAEALVRWKHPKLGLVSPMEFIPIAEETGLIVSIGKWVLETACQQNKMWQKQGLPQMKVAVNVSSIQLQDRYFVKMVERTLEKYQLAPELLELEVTESVMRDVKETSAILHQLKEIGVKISIDDFGTGYSSLNFLNQLPIDFVKIDKSFIDDMTTNPTVASLVKTIIHMGTNLKFDLIAEGIENKQQADFLRQNGCRFGQGYLFSRPLPAEELKKLHIPLEVE